MGIFDFIKDAGEKIGIGRDEPKPDANEELDELKKANMLHRVVSGMNLGIEDLRIEFDDGTATIYGTAPSQKARESAVLFCGNVNGVARVDDRMTVVEPEPEAQFYTVKSGDSLSKIAKEFYGDAMKYNDIFEANTPMLKNADLIYPGQVLRIPPQA
ncbi:MAG: peptidoglycan-binding protein LysM [Gemmatimonadetes bacterium]|nr:peptidoglycan-binding protein LysM [Gemmatimonadota bacterium]